MKRTLILAAVATAVAGQVRARDYISIVGSSTVYPFATVSATIPGTSPSTWSSW